MPNLRDAAIAANRFGFGARHGELNAIAGDPRGWIKAQLRGPAPIPPAIAALPAAEDDLLAFGRWLVARRLAGPNADQARQRLERQGVDSQRMEDLSIEQSFVQSFRARVQSALDARMAAALASDAPVSERLVHFWSNHFTVSTIKPQAVALPPSFEKDAIRPNVRGGFADMLRASTQHVGMLVYLDNWLSIGPHSLAASDPRILRTRMPQGAARATGINENLGREILELHTLGVDGGYTQQDVQALAAIITGWTYDRVRPIDYTNERVGTRGGLELFRFVAEAHEPGAKTLLGRVYWQDGVRQGEAALNDLARHPSTARHIATKLARHYIADTPPPAAVERIAAAFSAHDGDIAHTMEAVVDCAETWEQPFTKFKQPEEYAISVLRAADIRVLPPGAALNILHVLGQRPYAAPGPDGWPDIADSWLTGDLVWKRLEFAQTYGARLGRADVEPVRLADAEMGPLLSPETREAIARAESPAQGLALMFGAPEYQRR